MAAAVDISPMGSAPIYVITSTVLMIILNLINAFIYINTVTSKASFCNRITERLKHNMGGAYKIYATCKILKLQMYHWSTLGPSRHDSGFHKLQVYCRHPDPKV